MDFIVNCFLGQSSAEFVAKFLAVKTETKIYGLSLDFFYYGREWLFYVKCFFYVLLLTIE